MHIIDGQVLREPVQNVDHRYELSDVVQHPILVRDSIGEQGTGQCLGAEARCNEIVAAVIAPCQSGVVMIRQTCAQKSGVFSGIVDIRQSTLAGSANKKAPANAEARNG